MEPEWDAMVAALLRSSADESALLDAATRCSHEQNGTPKSTHWWSHAMRLHAPPPAAPAAHDPKPKPIYMLSACSGICAESEVLKVSWL